MFGSYPKVNENVASTFKTAAKVAVPGIKVFENYSYDLSDRSKCERLASDQIDRGSVVVFADAGACGAGALSAAETRRVWGVRADQDPSHAAEPLILASTMRTSAKKSTTPSARTPTARFRTVTSTSASNAALSASWASITGSRTGSSGGSSG